jgi:hypothetical protein
VTIADRVRGTVGALSDNCARNETRTAADCVEVAGLRAELAIAVEAQRLEARTVHLRHQVIALRERGGSAAPDPVGEFWAWITRGTVSVKDVGFSLPLAFALMIEMVSAFGPLGIASYAEATRTPTETDASRHVAAERAMSRKVQTSRDASGAEKDIGRVVHYMADRTQPTTRPAAIGVDEIYGDYEVWCLSKALRPLSQQEFVDEFDRVRESPQLAGKIKKFGLRYFGIAFVESNLAGLPTSRIS